MAGRHGGRRGLSASREQIASGLGSKSSRPASVTLFLQYSALPLEGTKSSKQCPWLGMSRALKLKNLRGDIHIRTQCTPSLSLGLQWWGMRCRSADEVGLSGLLLQSPHLHTLCFSDVDHEEAVKTTSPKPTLDKFSWNDLRPPFLVKREGVKKIDGFKNKSKIHLTP